MRKKKEIDVVVDASGNHRLFVEVKYRESAPIAEQDAIVEFCDRADAAMVVTRNAMDFDAQPTASGKSILRIPAFMFLYLLGHEEKNGHEGVA